MHNFLRSCSTSRTDVVVDGEVGHQQHHLAVECVVGELLGEVPTQVHGGEAQLVQLGSDTSHQGKGHLQHDGGNAELVQLEGQLVQQWIEFHGQYKEWLGQLAASAVAGERLA